MICEGSDITLVGWGAQLSIMEQACLEAEKVYGSFCLVLSDFVERIFFFTIDPTLKRSRPYLIIELHACDLPENYDGF